MDLGLLWYTPPPPYLAHSLNHLFIFYQITVSSIQEDLPTANAQFFTQTLHQIFSHYDCDHTLWVSIKLLVMYQVCEYTTQKVNVVKVKNACSVCGSIIQSGVNIIRMSAL